MKIPHLRKCGLFLASTLAMVSVVGGAVRANDDAGANPAKASGSSEEAGTSRFEFFFHGGDASYSSRGASTPPTSHGFTGEAMSVAFTLTGADSFAFNVTFASGSPTTETFTGSLSGTTGSGIDRIRLFSFDAGAGGDSNAFFNSIAIVPEASTYLAAAFLLGVLGVHQRKRLRARLSR